MCRSLADAEKWRRTQIVFVDGRSGAARTTRGGGSRCSQPWALNSRPRASHVRALIDEPAGYFLLHDALRRCERDGLVRSRRDARGRRYALTPAGRARLRAQRRFEDALLALLSRSRQQHARTVRS
jgi:hypothetical protein